MVAGDVLPLDALAAHVVIGPQQLQGGGQVVAHELADLGQLGGILLHLLKNLVGHLGKPLNLGADGRILDAVV